jgi:hypothetical protein
LFDAYSEYDDEGGYVQQPMISDIYFFDAYEHCMSVNFVVDGGTKDYVLEMSLVEVIINKLENRFWLEELKKNYTDKKIPIYIGE